MLDDYVRSKDAKTAVLLAKEYRVDSWLKAAYIHLLQRGPLEIEELLQTPSLDWETIARLSYARQLKFCDCAESWTQINLAIERSFKMELDNIKWTPSALAGATTCTR